MNNPQKHPKEQPSDRKPSASPNPSPTDLINETTPTTQTLDTTSLQTSKHHTDFRIRNHPKTLKLATILSDLQQHLSAARRSENQSAFNDICARITKAGEGLSSLTQPMLVEKADSATTKLDGEQMSDVCRSMKECEWY